MTKFKVWDAECDVEEDAVVLDTYDEEMAASEYVEKMHSDRYWESGNGPVDVMVKPVDPVDGKDAPAAKYEVYIDFSPDCSAVLKK